MDFGLFSIARALTIAVLLLETATAVAQDSTQVRRMEEVSSSPSVIINRKSPTDLLLLAAPGVVFNSSDEGGTWKTQPAWSQSIQDFTVYPARKGEYYCFQISQTSNGVEAFVSEDNGATWKNSGKWQAPGMKIMSPRVSVNQKTAELMLTWIEFVETENGCSSNIQFYVTKDGKKWSDAKRINRDAGDCSGGDGSVQGAMPASTIDGKTFVTWSFNGKIYLDRTFDKGSFWLTNDIPVIDQAGGWALDIPNVPQAHGLPSFVVDNSPSQYNGSLCLLYGSQRPSGETDIYFSRSHNLGDNWTSTGRISDGIGAYYSYMPALTIDNTTGILYGAFYARKAKEENLVDVYLAYSADNGGSFKLKQLNRKSFPMDASAGQNLSIDAYRGLIAVAWTEVEEGKPYVQVATLKQETLITLPKSGAKKK